MKIETIDSVKLPAAPQHRAMDPGLMRRTLLAVALAVCMIAALRWALNVTTANARRVSSSLTNLQGSIDAPISGSLPAIQVRNGSEKPETGSTNSGLILEPVDHR